MTQFEGLAYCVVQPPSIEIDVPVICLAPSLQRNETVLAI